jgi:predicted small metal-binding protein
MGAARESQEERAMAMLIKCECGFVARADTEDDVTTKIRDHMRQDHPDLLTSVSDEDLRGWIERD